MAHRKKKRTKARRHVNGFGILPALPLLIPGLLAAAAGVGFLVVRAKKAAGAPRGGYDTSLDDAAEQAAAQAQATFDTLNRQAASAQAAAGIQQIVMPPAVAAKVQDLVNSGVVLPTANSFVSDLHSTLFKLNGYVLPPMLHGFL